jgi:N-acetylglucosaminyl-diphospho-decaprenol L-rhamnosyltransferase
MEVCLTIVIVNWNTKDLLKQCLESVVRSSANNSSEIIVVDNASIDGSLEMIEADFPEAVLIRNASNLGFAKANNSAISLARGRYICLLNSDTVVNFGSIQELVQFMEKTRGAVACAPALRLPSARLQTGAAGFELSLRSAFNYNMFLSKLFPTLFPGMYIDQESFVAAGNPLKVDWVAGTCMLVAKSVIEEVGMLDDGIYLYAEDVEWCHRLRTRGDIYYLPYVEITHYHGASSDKTSTKWLESTFDYYRRMHSLFDYKIFQFIFVVGLSLRLFMYTIFACFNLRYWINVRAMKSYTKYSISRFVQWS